MYPVMTSCVRWGRTNRGPVARLEWRGVSRTARSIQKCNKKGTSDQNFECQIFHQNFCPTYVFGRWWKSVPMVTLFPKCSQGNPFFSCENGPFLVSFPVITMTLRKYRYLLNRYHELNRLPWHKERPTEQHLTTAHTALHSSFLLHHHDWQLQQNRTT